jgi:hypothetical protein
LMINLMRAFSAMGILLLELVYMEEL